MDDVLARRDRAIGIVLLVLAVFAGFLPEVEVGGQLIRTSHAGIPWLGAAILLLSMDSARRPNPRLVRWIAAIFFVGGLLNPFLVNLIDQSLGA